MVEVPCPEEGPFREEEARQRVAGQGRRDPSLLEGRSQVGVQSRWDRGDQEVQGTVPLEALQADLPGVVRSLLFPAVLLS